MRDVEKIVMQSKGAGSKGGKNEKDFIHYTDHDSKPNAGNYYNV